MLSEALVRRSIAALTVVALSAVAIAVATLLDVAPGLAQRQPRMTPAPPPGATVKAGPVILARFPDVPHPVDRRRIQYRLGRELNEYVQEMSYGRAGLAMDVTETWPTLPHPVAHYAIFPSSHRHPGRIAARAGCRGHGDARRSLVSERMSG
jgi:hypothetical protein